VLAGLCGNTLIGFDGLAAHQRHGWDLFLYQIAALALERSGEAEAVADDTAWQALDDPRAWRDRLAALTPGCAETAWCLVVQDLAKPALLQPPIGTGRLDDYKIAGETPDEIDVLVTSKDHDVKAARAGSAEPRHWLFALVTLQTLQGYSGRGNFGIARMNGGFASRPLVMRTPDRSLAAASAAASAPPSRRARPR
jgi:CRISPR system Cascade subunit CasA